MRSGEIEVLPVLIHGRTLAHVRLGVENLLRVRFEEREFLPPRRPGARFGTGKTEAELAMTEHAVRDRQRMECMSSYLTNGFDLAGQHYRLFCAKGKFVWFVAVGGRWSTQHAALQSLADFQSCGLENGPAKYAVRPQLALSQTFDALPLLFEHCEGLAPALGRPPHVERLRVVGGEWRGDLEARGVPPEGTLRIVEVDDDRGTEGGEMTDGMGLISADLAGHIPRVGHGQAIQATDEIWDLGDLGQQDGGPLVTQMRLWYAGSLAKGTLMRDATLPPRTIVVRRSMVKVNGSDGCTDAPPLAFEVNQTSEFARPCRTSSQLIPILEALGSDSAVHELLKLAEIQRSKIVGAADDLKLLRELSMRGYKEHDHPGDNPAEARKRWGVPIEARALMAGFKRADEPYLDREVRCWVVAESPALPLAAAYRGAPHRATHHDASRQVNVSIVPFHRPADN